MKFCWSTLRVKDMETSINFYKEIIGLSVSNRFKAGLGVEIAFLGDGETKIELMCDKTAVISMQGRIFHVVLKWIPCMICCSL
ncbi:MAG: VOC family protein [Bacteroidales bacterium]